MAQAWSEKGKRFEGEPMKSILVLACILLISTAAFAQTRSRTSSRRATSNKTSKTSADEGVTQARTSGATKVAEKIKNLTTFLYLLGGVAKELDAQTATLKSGETSPTMDRNKAKLRSSFEDFRVGLDQLEVYFRSTPGLEGYYRKLVGSASGAASAEDLAAAGRFDQAGRTLLEVVNRLTDVLLQMR
jgi:hypothetical protein